MTTDAVHARLLDLCDVVLAEIRLVTLTDGELFAASFTVDRAFSLDSNNALAEKVDAFAARFGRLQDTTADKLLPALLKLLGQSSGPVIDNLGYAEKWGWIESAQFWMSLRALRNKIVHEYIKDPVILCDALNAAHQAVPRLVADANRVVQEARARLPAH